MRRAAAVGCTKCRIWPHNSRGENLPFFISTFLFANIRTPTLVFQRAVTKPFSTMSSFIHHDSVKGKKSKTAVTVEKTAAIVRVYFLLSPVRIEQNYLNNSRKDKKKHHNTALVYQKITLVLLVGNCHPTPFDPPNHCSEQSFTVRTSTTSSETRVSRIPSLPPTRIIPRPILKNTRHGGEAKIDKGCNIRHRSPRQHVVLGGGHERMCRVSSDSVHKPTCPGIKRAEEANSNEIDEARRKKRDEKKGASPSTQLSWRGNARGIEGGGEGGEGEKKETQKTKKTREQKRREQ